MNIIKASEYPKLIASLSLDQRVLFYEIFAHNLTIAIRGSWSDQETEDKLKIDQMKWLNEIMHRVTSKIRNERYSYQEWTELSFIKMVSGYVENCPSIGGNVAWCIEQAYNRAINKNES